MYNLTFCPSSLQSAEISFPTAPAPITVTGLFFKYVISFITSTLLFNYIKGRFSIEYSINHFIFLDIGEYLTTKIYIYMYPLSKNQDNFPNPSHARSEERRVGKDINSYMLYMKT